MMSVAAMAQSPKEACLMAGGRMHVTNPAMFTPTGISLDSRKAAPSGLKGNKAAAISKPDVSTIIWNQPEGQLLKDVYRTSEGYVVYYSSVMRGNFDGKLGSLVKAADGTMYMESPYSAFRTDTWMRLDKGKGDTLVAHLPQCIYDEDWEGEHYTYYAYNLEYSSAAQWYLPSEDQDIKFVYRNDTLKMVHGTMLGMIYDKWDANGNLTRETEWNGYGDWDYQFTPMVDKLVTPPSDFNEEGFKMYYGLGQSVLGKALRGGFSGNTLYIKGLYNNLPNAWVKGELKDNKITFGSAQYIGDDYSMGYRMYMFGGISEQVWNDDYQLYLKQFSLRDNIVFDYDPDTRTLTAGQTDVIIINTGKKQVGWADLMEGPEVTPFNEVPATPANPEILSLSDYSTDYGYGYFMFDVPMFDTDGNFIDPAKITIKMWVDGEPFTFYADEYYGLREDTEELPYFFNNNENIFASDRNHYIYFYFTGFDKLGVQSIYRGGGETHASGIYYWPDGVEDGIEGVSESHGAIVGTTYTDITGRRTTKPGKGIYVKTVTLQDGTRHSVKEIHR